MRLGIVGVFQQLTRLGTTDLHDEHDLRKTEEKPSQFEQMFIGFSRCSPATECCFLREEEQIDLEFFQKQQADARDRREEGEKTHLLPTLDNNQMLIGVGTEEEEEEEAIVFS